MSQKIIFFSPSQFAGIMTILTMTFLWLEARTDLPKVPYLTALDIFVFLSFSFIFLSIIEFATVHYYTKYGSGECYFIGEDDDNDDNNEDSNISDSEAECSTSQGRNKSHHVSSRSGRHRSKMPRFNSVSKIDRTSRLGFPLFFLTINLFYWFAYLSRSKRIELY